MNDASDQTVAALENARSLLARLQAQITLDLQRARKGKANWGDVGTAHHTLACLTHAASHHGLATDQELAMMEHYAA